MPAAAKITFSAAAAGRDEHLRSSRTRHFL
jgi:hypothetical protein